LSEGSEGRNGLEQGREEERTERVRLGSNWGSGEGGEFEWERGAVRAGIVIE